MIRARVVGLVLFAAASAGAQPSWGVPVPPPQPPPQERDELGEGGRRLRDHYGAEVAARLVHSPEPDERLRGVERAASVAAPLASADACKPGAADPGCDEARRGLELLTQAAEPSSLLRGDGRTMLAIARALAPFTAQAPARAALVSIMGSAAPTGRTLGGKDESEADLAARAALARGTAAIALACAKDARAVEGVVAAARGAGAAQPAASAALAACRVSPWSPGMPTPASVTAVQTLSRGADLRSLDALRAAAKSSDPSLRAAALLGLAQLGDGRAVELAQAAIGERDARVRAAAAEVFVLLDAATPGHPDVRYRAVQALVEDEVTAAAGVRLSERAQDGGVARALAARAVATADRGLRRSIVHALGRGSVPESVAALLALVNADPTLDPDAMHALARSPSPLAIAAIEKAAQTPARRRLALRAYFVRRAQRGERSDVLDDMLSAAATSRDPKDRQVGVLALVALRAMSASAGLSDPDPGVRRAAALGALGARGDAARPDLLARYVIEKDPATRIALASGLATGDPDGVVPTMTLVDRAESGDADAPLAALALARRGDKSLEPKIDALLASTLPTTRAHAALGLAESPTPSATGRLANALAVEPDAAVRRVLVGALARRDAQTSPVGRRALMGAALDPDDDVRVAASRALEGRPLPGPPMVREIAWLRAVRVDGAPPPAGLAGVFVPSWGVAVPFVFDDDGYALLPDVAAGEGQVVLAPRVPGATDKGAK